MEVVTTVIKLNYYNCRPPSWLSWGYYEQSLGWLLCKQKPFIQILWPISYLTRNQINIIPIYRHESKIWRASFHKAATLNVYRIQSIFISQDELRFNQGYSPHISIVQRVVWGSGYEGPVAGPGHLPAASAHLTLPRTTRHAREPTRRQRATDRHHSSDNLSVYHITDVYVFAL